MTILERFKSRGLRFKRKNNELLYLKNAGISDEVIEDIKKCKKEILRALDEEKEEWVKCLKREKAPHIIKFINIVIEDRYE